MANTQSQNTLYFDTTGTLNSGNRTRVSMIILTSSASTASVTLVDPLDSGDVTKLALAHDSGNGSAVFDLSGSPILFLKGVKVSAISGAKLTIIYNEG